MKILDRELDPKTLSMSERLLAEFVSKNLDKMIYLSTNEIAEALDLSAATVSRFWRSIGFASFKDFKQALKTSIENDSPAGKMKDILNRVEKQHVFDVLADLVSENIRHTAAFLDADTLDAAVRLLAESDAVYLFASGAATALNELLAFRLHRLGHRVHVRKGGGSAVLESLLNISSRDVAVIFSFSHVRSEQRVILDHCQRQGIPSLLITDLLTSELVPQADIVLQVERGEIWEFHSMVPPLLLVESLVVGLARLKEAQALNKLETLSALRERYKDELPR